MLVWVAALHCEARPIIDYYRLKKSASHHAFDLYRNDQVECIVSGIGKLASAAATAWIAALNHEARSIAWINIGTAGSATHNIGTALLINKISESCSSRHYYPVVVNNTGFQLAHCQTLVHPSTDYRRDWVYDMEASAFFDTATRFSSAELVQCVKIVSDNPATRTGKDKARVSELIGLQIEPMARFAEKLQELNESLARLELSISDSQKFLSRARFSQTQKSQLNISLRFLKSQRCQLDALVAEVSRLNSAAQIIAYLDAVCVKQSRDL